MGMSRFFTVMLRRCLVSELLERAEQHSELRTSALVYDLYVASCLVVSIFLIALTTLGMIRLLARGEDSITTRA